MNHKKKEEESDEKPVIMNKVYFNAFSFNWQGKIYPTFQQNKEINF